MKNESALVPLFSGEITNNTIQEAASSYLEKVNGGDIDPLTAVASLTAITKFITAVKKNIISSAVDEFDKYGEKEVVMLGGCHVTKKEAGVKYDYSNTDKWNELKAIELEAANNRKDFEKQIKTFKKPGMISVDDEMVEVNPPIRTSTTTLAVTIK